MRNLRKYLGHVVGVLAALPLVIGATAMLGSQAAAPREDETAVREVLLKNGTGFERRDIEALSKLWAQDEAMTVFESGSANYGWADYRDHHLVPEMDEMNNTKYPITDIQPRIAGTTAWATFKYTISAELKERHVQSSGLGTAVLEKRDGRWQIVHWHTSNTRRPSTPAAKN